MVIPTMTSRLLLAMSQPMPFLRDAILVLYHPLSVLMIEGKLSDTFQCELTVSIYYSSD